MLRSIKKMYGNKLGALDGEIGHVKDFYFDDQNWVVRYVVVNTGTWLSGFTVLLSPHSFRNFDSDGVSTGVNLTRKQIEDSPGLESHKPISRQFQEEYYRYYRLPAYWKGHELWGAHSYPEPHLTLDHSLSSIRDVPSPGNPDAHLRSAQAVSGYHIQTEQGNPGHITDFVIDGKSWSISHLVVSLWSKEVLISPKEVQRISYNESKVFVNISSESILDAPEYCPSA